MTKQEESATVATVVARQAAPKDGKKSAEQPALSRLDRLKLKIRKLQGKDPDIYPMF